MAVKLGELLLKESMVTPRQLQEALNHQKMSGGRLRKSVVALGFVKDEEITGLLSRQYGVPSIHLDDFEVDPAIIRILPGETVRKYMVLPLARTGAVLTIAMADPTNVFAMDDIKFMTGYNVEPVVASESLIEDAIERYYGSRRSLEQLRDAALSGGGHGTPGGFSLGEAMEGPGLTIADLASTSGLSEIDLDSMGDAEADVETLRSDDNEIDLRNLAKSTPVTALTNVLLVDSLKRGASDIHIEPYEREFRVRFRIDGILHNVMALPMKLRDPLIARVKIMACLDMVERRIPQEGRIKVKLKVEDRSRDLEFHVSVRPTLWGEKIVMRLHDKSTLMLDMARLGFEAHSLERFKNAIAKLYGIVLLSGPRRSGRTNTIYSALASLNKPDTNIMTAEDPVEFALPGINQVQVNESVGESFASVLRSLLRQDPNIILVGETRDPETAEIAVRAALKGHLLLSTIHANDAPSTVSRLVNLGIDPFLVASAVNLIQAQRLVRRICARCRLNDTPNVPIQTLLDIGFAADQVGSFQVMKGRGCATCNGTGYNGRVGLFEVMEISEGIRDLIMVRARTVEIKRLALEEGMLTLRMSGLEKIKQGITTIEEVLRETVLS